MQDTERAARRVRALLTDSVEAGSLRTLIGISGTGHTIGAINVTINAGADVERALPTDDRGLRLAGIRAKLGRVLKGEAKCLAYIQRHFGKRSRDDLTDAELEQLWSWVMTLSAARPW